MPFSWILPSIAPHDFFISLDVDSYFDFEHNPAEIPETGFARTIPLTNRDVLVHIHFNGDPENPSFTIETEERLSEDEKVQANLVLARILGTNLDLKPLYEQAKNDALLAPMFTEMYGLKRISRANFFEDAMNRIIVAQISHKPTAKKMVYGVRQAYGTRLENSKGVFSAWPRPNQLIGVDPMNLKKHGLSLRKGEYVVGLAHEIVSGELESDALENESPMNFYERMLDIRGIGPTTAQDLMLFRGRPDGVFPSKIEKNEEKGLRKWIIMSYNEDPDQTDEKTFHQLIRNWNGYEALALEHLYVNWILGEKRKRMNKKGV